MSEETSRINWIDYVKAFACFLVVLGHLIQSLQKANIDNNIVVTSFIDWFIYLFHMPLFMCMSGFLYCKNKKNFSWEKYKKFEIKKIINLLIPYITFYLLFIFINIIFSSSVNSPKGIEELLGIFNNPISPYWFLYALLSIFLVVPLLEKIANEKIVFVIFIILKIISFFIQTPIYAINSIMSYGIYFYFGNFISKDSKKTEKKIISLVVIYIAISICVYNCQENWTNNIYRVILAIVGIYICVNLFKTFNKCKVLDTFKKYTFQIFLLHTIFAAGIRIILLKLGITNYWVHFILGLLFSIYIPVIISKVSEKIIYTNFFFYPVKTVEKLKEIKMLRNKEEA